MFSLQQNRRTRGQNRFCPEVGVGVSETMYKRSKCKNDKTKTNKLNKIMLERQWQNG
jgi:hypothetical protein